MPIVRPGATGVTVSAGLDRRVRQHVGRAGVAPRAKLRANLGSLVGDDRCRKKGGIRSARLSDGERADRKSLWHLQDGEQSVYAIQCRRGNRNAEDGQWGV